jgi:hypothetical protein
MRALLALTVLGGFSIGSLHAEQGFRVQSGA